MSSLGRNLGRALGGIGAGVAALSSKYIDEELTQQRAQALADIQFAGAKRTEAWQQSAEVQGPRLANQRNELAMRNEESLKGRVAEASSPELRQARVDERVSYLEGTTPAEVAAANARIEGTSGAELDKERMRRKVLDPMDVSKAAATADATWAAREKYDQRLEGKSGSASVKMPEMDRIRYGDLAKSQEKLQEMLDKASIDGGLVDKDGNERSEVIDLRKRIVGHQVAKMKILARNGALSGSDDAAAVLDGETNPEVLKTSLLQARAIGGTYAQEFAAVVQPALERLQKQPQPGASPRPPAGAPMPPAQPASANRPAAAEGEPEWSNLMSKATKWFGETGRDYSTPEGKQALRQRLAEAKAGGQALTGVEQMRAQQLGLM